VDLKVRKYLAKIGSKGGTKSKRILSSESAKKMVRLRESRRAFVKFYNQCFWSYDPNYKIEYKDIKWVSQQLIKNGNLELWKIGKKLCP
jgi:hypothetical protein